VRLCVEKGRVQVSSESVYVGIGAKVGRRKRLHLKMNLSLSGDCSMCRQGQRAALEQTKLNHGWRCQFMPTGKHSLITP